MRFGTGAPSGASSVVTTRRITLRANEGDGRRISVPGGKAIDRLREHTAEGKYEKARDLLWTAEYNATNGSLLDLQAFLEAPRELHAHLDGNAREECARYIACAQERIEEADGVEPYLRGLRKGMPVSTANNVPGWEITDYVGEVFGMVVRSRGAFPQFGANLKAVFGGELGTMTNLLRDTRTQAIARMVDDAERRGADAVVAMRFDVTSMGETTGWTEVCAYGTAVCAHKLSEAEQQQS